MSKFQEIHLRDRVGEHDPLTFLSAKVSKEYLLPFALIHYTIRGKTPDYGLRLDLDKRVFIDHLEDDQDERVLQEAAPKIAEIIGDEVKKITG